MSGREDDAVSILQMGSGGVLTDVTVAFDDAGLALDGTRYSAFATVGGKPFLIATGFDDNGLSVFELLPPGGDNTDASPTDIIVQGGTVQENAEAGTVVATLGAVDPTADETFTFGVPAVTAPSRSSATRSVSPPGP